MFKILLVNDAGLLVEMEKSFLKRMACSILLSENEKDALAKALRVKPDVIVLDSAVQSVDAFRCCRALKSMVETRTIPVIFITTPEEKDRCVAAGCDSLVKKPVTRDNFIKALSDFLDLKERTAERVGIVKKVKCNLLDDSTPIELYSKDLSVSGIFLKSKYPVAVGSSIVMDFLLGGKESERIHASGEVVRKVEHERDSHLISGMGIHFKEMSTADRFRIQEFIQNLPAEKQRQPGV